jgi:hypothetical protein
MGAATRSAAILAGEPAVVLQVAAQLFEQGMGTSRIEVVTADPLTSGRSGS